MLLLKDLARLGISEVYNPFVVVDGMNFVGAITREPFQPALSFWKLRLMLSILNVHTFAELDVSFVFSQVPFVVLLGISFLKSGNLLGSFSKSILVDDLHCIYQWLGEFHPSKIVC